MMMTLTKTNTRAIRKITTTTRKISSMKNPLKSRIRKSSRISSTN